MLDFQTAYERLRSPENRIYLGAFVGLLAITGIVGCLVLYQFIKAPQTTPALVFAPKALVTMTVEPSFIPAETATLPVQQEIFVAPTAKVKATARVKATAKVKATARANATSGQSCNYSSASLNQILPPAPSGSWSPIEHYFCDNGYWEIGKFDIVDRKTGAWGQDGVAEKILIKYDSGGMIADRIFIDPEGQQFSGPKH
jgi:hypothetical protein